MNTKMLFIQIALLLVFASCKKEDSASSTSTFNVDTQKYSTSLNLDYFNANQYYLLLNQGGVNKNILNQMMYSKNDSLFSIHFSQFCIDMMKNSGMMGDMGGTMSMKGNGMMGGTSGEMMNGNSMGGTMDMNKMLAYMDSLCLASKNTNTPDYLKNDSLLNNQLSICKMLTSNTTGVSSVYNMMLSLRRNHKLIVL